MSDIAENIAKEPFANVLVVDDSEIILKLVRNYLRSDNYKVTTAIKGYEALDFIDGGGNFDLIVLDVILPDISGFEVCKLIRQKFSLNELPILFLTGLKEIMNIVEGFYAGGNDYLVKPFNSQEFMVRAKTLIKLKKLTQTNEALQEAIEMKNRALVQLQQEIAYRLKIEKELIAAKEIADDANKLKSQFLANMSHEIRTPMNAILGFSEILKNRITDEKNQSYIDSVINSGKNLLVVINDILDLSKIEAGKIDFELAPVSLKQLVNDIGQIFALKIQEKNLTYISEVSDHIPEYINLDESRIRQLLVNLVGNAIKFTSKGTVEVKVIPDNINKINTTINLNIIISDTGIGIPEDQQDVIFDAFTQQEGQSKKAYGGTGLGLTITKRLVEMMGGSINVESTPGKGSSFRIYLPDIKYFIKDFDNEETNELYQTGSLEFEPTNILIVEDIMDDLDLVSEYLDGTGLSIAKLTNAKSIPDYLATTTPGLILMDIKMPEMDGFEAKKLIQADPAYANIPIIAMTAYAMKSDKEKIWKAGFSGYLLKPIKRTDLLIELMKYIPYQIEEKITEQSSKEEFSFDFSDNELSPVIIKEMLELYENEFDVITKSYRIGQIKDFVNKLESITVKYNCDFIKPYIEKLEQECDELDMKRIKQSLNIFSVIINKITKNNF